MNHDSAIVLKIQNLLKQRRIENKRLEEHLKSIELSERRVFLANERKRHDFLNLVRTKREKWWLSDDNVRHEFTKKEFKDSRVNFKPANETGKSIMINIIL